VTADAWASAAHAWDWLDRGNPERLGRQCEHQVLGERRRPRHCTTNLDQVGHVTKDLSGPRAKGAGPQRREKKKERAEVGRLGQNRLEKEECPGLI
jgi:hypothetical protein